jgi:hypothetical protein
VAAGAKYEHPESFQEEKQLYIRTLGPPWPRPTASFTLSAACEMVSETVMVAVVWKESADLLSCTSVKRVS